MRVPVARFFLKLLMTTLALATAATCMAQDNGIEEGLIGTAWLAEDISGRGVIDYARSTVEFAGQGRIAGSGACNRYMGPVSFDGDSVVFGNLAATMMACPEAVMAQEQKFLAALAKVDRLELVDGGQRLLGYADGVPVVRFSRIVEK